MLYAKWLIKGWHHVITLLK